MMKRFGMGLVCLLFLAGSGWAGTLTSKGFLYKPSVGARGQTESDTFNAGLDRVDARLAKETWLGDPGGTPGYDTLAHAITTIGTNKVILRLPAGSVAITADTTIPANITLKPERGGTFAVADGKTLTINSGFEAGLYQVFTCSGSGKVVFGPGAVKEVLPQWWGAKADDLTFDQTPMFQAAMNSLGAPGGIVSYPPGRYAVNLVVDAYNITLNGPSLTTSSNSFNWLAPWDVTKPVLQIANCTKNIRGGGLNNVTLNAAGPNGAGQVGLKLAGGAYQWSANNLTISGFTDKGIYGISDATYPVTYVNFNNLTVMSPTSGSYTAAVYLDYGASYLTALSINNFNISSMASGKALVLDGVRCNLSNGWIQVSSSGNGIKFMKSGSSTPGLIGNAVEVDSPNSTDVLVESYTTDPKASSYFRGYIAVDGKLKLSDSSTTNITTGLMAPYLGCELSYPNFVNPYIVDSLHPVGDSVGQLVRSYGNYVKFLNSAGSCSLELDDSGMTKITGSQLYLATTPLCLAAASAAPSSPSQGMVCLADQVSWDPLAKGSGGPYLVWYNGTAWKNLTSSADSATLWGPYASCTGPTQARTYTLPDANKTLLASDGNGSGLTNINRPYPVLGPMTLSPNNGASYYFCSLPTSSGGAGNVSQTLLKGGTITDASVTFYGSAGSSETSTVTLEIYSAAGVLQSSTAISNAVNLSSNGPNRYSVSGLSLAVPGGGRFEYKWVTPTWVTRPTGLGIWGSVNII